VHINIPEQNIPYPKIAITIMATVKQIITSNKNSNEHTISIIELTNAVTYCPLGIYCNPSCSV